VEPTTTHSPSQLSAVSPGGLSPGGIGGLVAALVLGLLLGVLVIVVLWKRGYLTSRPRAGGEPEYALLAFAGLAFPLAADMFGKSKADLWEQFERLVLAEDKAYLSVLIKGNLLSVPVLQGVFFLYARSNKVVDLLSFLVTSDLDHAGGKAPKQVFGPNSPSARVFTLFCRQVGLPYLYFTFHSFIEHLLLSIQGDDPSARKSGPLKTSTPWGSSVKENVELGNVSTNASRSKLLLDTLEIDSRLLAEGMDEMDVRSNALTLELTLEKLHR